MIRNAYRAALIQPPTAQEISAARSDVGYVEITLEQLLALPQSVQDLLQTYGREEPQGWGKPSRIYLTTGRLRELEEAMIAAGRPRKQEEIER